jgi:hypothetical protein
MVNNDNQSQPKKILEGDDLPHQVDDIIPEGITEAEQDPPEEIITPDDYSHQPYERLVESAELESADEELKPYIEAARHKKIAPPPPTDLRETHVTNPNPRTSWIRKLRLLFKNK